MRQYKQRIRGEAVGDADIYAVSGGYHVVPDAGVAGVVHEAESVDATMARK
jgi:hypothetical protein